MSRDELNAAQLDELAALDRILAGEPLGEEHLELAALVASVRASAPRMDPGFAAQLDARIAGLGARRRRARPPRAARPRMRTIAITSSGLVAAAVALTIVISSGVLAGGGGHPAANERRALGGIAATPRTPGSSINATTTGPQAGGATTIPAAAGSGAAAVPSSTFSTATGRLVEHDSSLTLATSPATMQGVANQIVAATERQGGVVASSSVEVHGSSSYADFSLQVPSGRLGQLIAALSALASVRALSQTTTDITDGYNQERARLADREAHRTALLKQLATAATVADQASIRKQLNLVQARIAAEHHELDKLATEGHTAKLGVTVVAGASAKHSALGPLTGAFNRAKHALEEILAIALIALAIVLPFALSALALWWGATTVRQRARERAMRTA